jgi:phytoene dehydrogenase-like protein
LIIGAGLAGLAAARTLAAAGLPLRLVEAAKQVGGRLTTDSVQGFQIDRGFQVLNDAYPEAREQLDLGALALRAFEPGALVRWQNRWVRFADPFRRPLAALSGLWSGPGNLGDRMRVLKLRNQALAGSLDGLWRRPESRSIQRLTEMGFSAAFIEGFLRPFLAGVFLEAPLETSSRMLDFVWRMFSLGNACLPAAGMGAIPAQMAQRLPAGALVLGRSVEGLERSGERFTVRLLGGETLRATALVVALDPPGTERLLQPWFERLGPAEAAQWPKGPPAMRAVTQVAFAAQAAPNSARLLMLNGSGQGRIAHLCVPSLVQPSYAPAGQHLVAVTLLGDPPEPDEHLEALVQTELVGWFGPSARAWRPLATQRVRAALPAQPPGVLEPAERPVRLAPGLYVCGDHRDQGSINGALRSGRRAAEALLAERLVPVLA